MDDQPQAGLASHHEPDRGLYTISQAARKLGLDKRLVKKMVDDKTLKGKTIKELSYPGYRIKHAEIERFNQEGPRVLPPVPKPVVTPPKRSKYASLPDPPPREEYRRQKFWERMTALESSLSELMSELDAAFHRDG